MFAHKYISIFSSALYIFNLPKLNWNQSNTKKNIGQSIKQRLPFFFIWYSCMEICMAKVMETDFQEGMIWFQKRLWAREWIWPKDTRRMEQERDPHPPFDCSNDEQIHYSTPNIALEANEILLQVVHGQAKELCAASSN